MVLPSGQLEVLVHDAASVVVLWRRTVLVQYRRGELTLDALQRIGASLRVIIAAGRPLGALLVVEGGAPVPSESARARQRSLVQEILKHPGLRMAPVVRGDDLMAGLNRSAGRLVGMGHKDQIFHGTEPAAGAAWLAAQLTELGAVVRTQDIQGLFEHCIEVIALASDPSKPGA